jgi:hypothetical protein
MDELEFCPFVVLELESGKTGAAGEAPLSQAFQKNVVSARRNFFQCLYILQSPSKPIQQHP